MTVTEISAASTALAASVPQAAESMGKEAFLKLLITQLQNQDPLNPTDSTEFTAQLAQFSSLEQLSNVNANLTRLEQYQASINNAQAVAFIGKEIVSKGNELQLAGSQPVACEFDLGADAQRVVVSVYSSSGAFVTDITGTALAGGRQSLTWNGRDRNGSPVADGTYSFEIQAEAADSTRVEATSLTRGRVTGVSFDGQTPYLMLGDRKVPFGAVLHVVDTTSSPPNG